MTAPVMHYALEVLYDTAFQPLCENQRGLDCFEEGEADPEMTDDERFVTCRDCLKALGHDAAPAPPYTRIVIDTDPKTGRARFAA